jgi:hypothetical protein
MVMATFVFPLRPWADFALYQAWDEGGGHGFMLHNRQQQAATGRIMPQINEEYGYEDHYPKGWGGDIVAPARSADNRRRLAWGMAMAGCYQTTGERANAESYPHVEHAPDVGGWLNGAGDDSMTMLNGYAHMVNFFAALAWWKLEPHDDLATNGAMCLALPGRDYVIYLPQGGSTTVQIEAGAYHVRCFNPRNGEVQLIGAERIETTSWRSPVAIDNEDWVLHLRRV